MAEVDAKMPVATNGKDFERDTSNPPQPVRAPNAAGKRSERKQGGVAPALALWGPLLGVGVLVWLYGGQDRSPEAPAARAAQESIVANNPFAGTKVTQNRGVVAAQEPRTLGSPSQVATPLVTAGATNSQHPNLDTNQENTSVFGSREIGPMPENDVRVKASMESLPFEPSGRPTPGTAVASSSAVAASPVSAIASPITDDAQSAVSPQSAAPTSGSTSEPQPNRSISSSPMATTKTTPRERTGTLLLGAPVPGVAPTSAAPLPPGTWSGSAFLADSRYQPYAYPLSPGVRVVPPYAPVGRYGVPMSYYGWPRP